MRILVVEDEPVAAAVLAKGLREHAYAVDVAGDGQARVASMIDVTSLKEPQGEAVALGAENSVFVAGEGGGKGQAGTFARLSCALPRE